MRVIICLGVVASALIGSACDGERVFCVEDTTLNVTIRLAEDGFIVGDEVIPYSERTFERCEVLGPLIFRGGQADDRYFPNLKMLAALGVDRTEVQPGDGPAQEVLEGFDGVTDLGALTGVRIVLGFNALERANSIDVGDIFGMARLEEVGSLAAGRTDAMTSLHTAGEVRLYASDRDRSEYGVPPLREITYGLPALRTVFGTLEVSGGADHVAFPELVDVGTLYVCCMSNTRGLQDMRTPQQTTVRERLILSSLQGSDEYYQAWADRNILSVGEFTLIEYNGISP